MECLPSDIAVDILSRLPVESVLDCKLVSKRWLHLLTRRRDQFARMHQQHQLLQIASSSTGILFSFKTQEDKDEGRLCYIDKYNDEMNIHENYSYETLLKNSFSYPHMIGWNGIVGSCNGLICLTRYHHEIGATFHICNPNTGEYVDLPGYSREQEDLFAVFCFGFGYVHSVINDQYKVVRIYYPDSGPGDNYCDGEVQVYTIGGGSGWRTIGTTSYQLGGEGIRVNGALHWIAGEKIVAFNLADEEFRVIQPPPCYDPPHCFHCFYMVQALSGNLCIAHRNSEEHLLDIWSPEKNATEEKWSRDFSIPYSAWNNYGGCSVRPLLITKTNEMLFVHDDSTLYCYDPKTKTVSKLWDDDEKSETIARFAAVPHMNSFVSLKALGERSERSESKKNAIGGSLEDPKY